MTLWPAGNQQGSLALALIDQSCETARSPVPFCKPSLTWRGFPSARTTPTATQREFTIGSSRWDRGVSHSRAL